jgi:hypothetical protein
MSSEIISTVERRRSWSAEQMLRIMSEVLEPGATVTAVGNRELAFGIAVFHQVSYSRDLSGLLSTLGKRPHHRCTAKNCDERAAFHAITSGLR